MDLAFLGAGALGGIGLVTALVVAVVTDGGKMTRLDAESSAAGKPVASGNPPQPAASRRA